MDTMTTTPAPFTPLDERLCFSFYSASMEINRLFKPILDALGITYSQLLVLSTLREKDGSAIGEIADRLGLESSTVTPLVKRLEQNGLLVRQRSAADERLVHVRLTEAGREIQHKVNCLGPRLSDGAGMSAEELTALNRETQRLLNALKAKRLG